MRILVLAALLCGGLCAQTPPAESLEPAPAPPGAIPVQASNPAAVEQNLERLRHLISQTNSIVVTPRGTGRSVLSAIVPFLSGHAEPAPGQTCSIPLINVGPKGGFTGDPKIVIPGSKRTGNLDHMPVIQGSPPCPQARR